MTVYWIDPFLEASTQGNGTTDTSTENGTYAAPFSFSQLRNTGGAVIGSANGVNFADGDELRIKGLPFSTLFESKGNVYSYSSSSSLTFHPLRPVTGNSSFDATISDTKSSIFAFQNSDIGSFFPGWSHPAFFAAYYTSDGTTQLDAAIGQFGYAVIHTQLGHTSASGSGIEVFRLKPAYTNLFNQGTTRYYWMQMQHKIKITAGWTSETAQEGYSILEAFQTGNYDYFYLNGNYLSKTHFDCERLLVCYATRTSGGRQNNLQIRIEYSDARTEATAHVAPMFINGHDRADYYYSDIYTGSSTVWPWIASSDSQYYNYMNVYNGSTANVRSVTFKNIILGGYVSFSTNHYNCTTNFGNMYVYSRDDDIANRPFFSGTGSTIIGGTFNFLQDSIIYVRSENTSLDNFLSPQDNLSTTGTVTTTYESGLIKPGLAPLNGLSSTSATYGPDSAGTIEESPIFSLTRDVSTNNTWFTPSLSRSGSNPIEYCSLAKLTCNGNDYRSTTHNIEVRTTTAIGTSDAPQYVIWSAEHNDYDGKPISIISDPFTAGSSYGVLMYNDTVSSTGVIVGQWSGTTGGASSRGVIPLELPAPSYVAGSDNLRVTVSAAYANGGSGGQEKITLIAHHRDTTQSNNFRAYSSSDTTITSSDPASPTTVTLNLTNVPTSGQEKITSVIVGIQLGFAGNTNIQKFYITNAAIETY